MFMNNKLKSKLIIGISIWVFITLVLTLVHLSILDWKLSLLFSISYVALYATLYYLQTDFLFPKLHLKGKPKSYIASLILLITLSALSIFIYERNIIKQSRPFSLRAKPERIERPRFKNDENFLPRNFFRRSKEERIFFIILNVLKFSAVPITLIISIGKSITEESVKARSREQAIISEKLKGEMDLLRSQINPHFLFNALNNIYSLSVRGSEDTSESILKLSGILRYVLYDCNTELVSIEKEINYIKNLIELQQLKTPYRQNISFELIGNTSEKQIAPMLLIPFIENSFKHSKIEADPDSFIKMKLTNNKTELQFSILNSIPTIEHQKDESSGIGLENVHKRLELIYPNQYTLTIIQNTSLFDVQLTIKG